MERMSFVERAKSIEGELFDFLYDTMNDPNVKRSERVKAATEILARGVPTLKAIEHRQTLTVNVNYVSPLTLAHQRRALSGPQPDAPLNLEESVEAGFVVSAADTAVQVGFEQEASDGE